MSGIHQKDVWVQKGEDGAVRGEEAVELGAPAACALLVVFRAGETNVNLLNGPSFALVCL